MTDTEPLVSLPTFKPSMRLKNVKKNVFKCYVVLNILGNATHSSFVLPFFFIEGMTK